MFTSILPFLAVALPTGVVLAMDPVTNTASIAPPTGSFDPDGGNNTATTITAVEAVIVATPDEGRGINAAVGGTGVVNVFTGDTIDGGPATRDNAVLSLAPGSNLPTGITFDTVTGNVNVPPGMAPGEYTFEYQICEIAIPTNCETALVTIEIVTPISALSGTVYLDNNGDRQLDNGDTRLGGWIVEALSGGNVIGTQVTGSDGSYAFPSLPGGTEYTIRFRSPDGGVVYEEITGIWLEDATTLPDQNLPIDPSGIIYDSVTRLPVAGATATLVDSNGIPLPDDCYVDASQSNQVTGASGAYRFDVVPGAATACPTGESEYTIRITPPPGYSFTSTVLPPQSNALDPTGRGSPLAVSPSPDVPTGNAPVYFISFELETGDPDIINNHIALDPFLARDGLVVTKTSTRRAASTGDLVPYEITVRNTENVQRAGVDVVDVLPPGMTYVTGTARVNGVAAEPQFENGNRELVWPGQIIPANGEVTYQLVLVVGAGVTEGQAVNTGLAENGLDGSEISNRGTATVIITPSTVFDCTELIGQVFEDYDGDGYQDDGEPGVPSVRLATVNGEIITTDEFGRYHIPCAAVPDARIGSNFVLEVDEASLPQGWMMTTDNPRSIRLTRGIMGVLNFGASEADLVQLDIGANAFDAAGNLKPEVQERLRALATGEETHMLVRATYAIAPGESEALITSRITAIRAALETVFAEGRDGPPPTIQVDASRARAASGGE
ncbi:DUF11 domain-containing protein [Erythrobacter sp. EC-HK427]|uniref:DUF11 domain-containing protein n=1 Tax=Erythrobacter sp. EC-HK427 TaxID=2038396 RepID=UPI0018FF00FC|nr:DUF11 domain-containing protein [Erythrobacter sp. EC-HK427]